MADNYGGSIAPIGIFAFVEGWDEPGAAPTPDYYRGTAPPIGAFAFYTGWSGAAAGGGGASTLRLRMLTGLGL